ncbi:MAG TPA: sn-glycerol-3-phosphate ABC transporter ATP-binding protein UgpC [Clostridiales bacterium]|jgi:multiple sugar transport system ATP-binding protein|nr:sn-glycerol-3-phosphate ABC transporter ATP-binding protein UgpC [Clostridiales bacterium]
MAGVKLQGIYKKYPGGVIAVSDFNLDIKDKEFIILVGPSGCGKTTTLRMIAGLEEITEGDLFIDDKLVNDIPPKDRDIAMVFQNYALYPHMSVFDNMAFGLRLRKTPKEEIKRRVEEAAKILDISHLLDRKPKALSGGQRQRVALGRAIVRNPKVFLLDEPLSNLDAKLRAQMRTELAKLHQRLQTTFVYVTHDQIEAMTMGTRIVVMKDGFIQQVASPTALYENPCNLFVATFIGSPQMNILDATVEDDGSSTWLAFGENKIKLPNSKGRNPEVLAYAGKEVIMGIRPESLHDEDVYLSQYPDATITVDVEVVEQLGSVTYLYVKTGESSMTASVSPRSTAKPGDKVKIAFDTNHIHLFDKDTEKVIAGESVRE